MKLEPVSYLVLAVAFVCFPILILSMIYSLKRVKPGTDKVDLMRTIKDSVSKSYYPLKIIAILLSTGLILGLLLYYFAYTFWVFPKEQSDTKVVEVVIPAEIRPESGRLWPDLINGQATCGLGDNKGGLWVIHMTAKPDGVVFQYTINDPADGIYKPVGALEYKNGVAYLEAGGKTFFSTTDEWGFR